LLLLLSLVPPIGIISREVVPTKDHPATSRIDSFSVEGDSLEEISSSIETIVATNFFAPKESKTLSPKLSISNVDTRINIKIIKNLP